jgi:membrane fusion protein, copper/silver efflux system
MSVKDVLVAMLAVGAAAATGCAKARPAAPAADHGRPGGMAMPDAGPGPVTVSPESRARLGILVVAAEVRALTREVRLVGQVVPAETAARTVTSRVDGFVERLNVDFTGRAVRRGEVLLELYSPLLVAAQQELLLAVRLRRALGADAAQEAAQNADSLVAAARRRLEFWDISDDQVAALERSGAVRRTLALRAPSDGVVMEKRVTQGQAVAAGAVLYQLADLDTVWLEADAFESDLGAVRVGQQAEVAFDAYPGEPVRGRVAFVYPMVDPASRTGRVRIELANPAARLRPGLFGTVRIVAPLGVRGVVVPRQAVLVTGDRQLVFVADSADRFLPRLVEMGLETDSLVEIRGGLRAGDRVVATAAFLLDAESNLGAAMAGMAGMPGMDMGPAPVPPAPRPASPPAPAGPPARRDSAAGGRAARRGATRP